MIKEVFKNKVYKRGMSIHVKIGKPQITIAFDTYWRFAVERQNIFFRRLQKDEFPWTEDEILNTYKFTNVYRATDRVSQYLIKNVIYRGDQCPEEIFFRILLFKIFNRISTWNYLIDKLGEISWKDYSFEKYDSILSNLAKQNIRIYSAAYIMASAKTAFGFKRKYQNHLRLIELMIKERVPYRIQNTKSMEEVYKILYSYPAIGNFLAYQYAIDINYSTLTDYSEMEFVKAGPGAKDGIMKCFKDTGEYSLEDIIKFMAEIQEMQFERLNIKFKTLWGRRLQLIDCQNIFCEVDKYSRIAHPDIMGASNRKRIKQKFSVRQKEFIDLYFPPKWEINGLIDYDK